MLLIYETLIIFLKHDRGAYARNAADVWIKFFIETLGAHGTFAFGLLILVLIGLAFVSMVREKLDINFKFILLSIFESGIYAWLFAFIASFFTSLVLVNLWISETTQIELTVALGAGVYEELIFRAIGYGLLAYGLTVITHGREMFKRKSEKKRALTIHVEFKLFAALLSSLVFAWLHNINSFSLFEYETLYRFCMGLLFCLLYEFRGLGIAVWTHSLYDVYVILLR